MSRVVYLAIREWGVSNNGALYGQLAFVAPDLVAAVMHAGAEFRGGNQNRFGYFQAVEGEGLGLLTFDVDGRLCGVVAHFGPIEDKLARSLASIGGTIKSAIKANQARAERCDETAAAPHPSVSDSECQTVDLAMAQSVANGAEPAANRKRK